MLKDATHGGIFMLSNGAELALAKNADGGWAFSGTVGGVTRTIAFTSEACDMIFGAMLFHRDRSKPALRVELLKMANGVVSHTGALPDSKITNQAPSPGVGL